MPVSSITLSSINSRRKATKHISLIDLTCSTTNTASYASKMPMQAMQHNVTQPHLNSNTTRKSVRRSLRIRFTPPVLRPRLYIHNFVHTSSYLMALKRRHSRSWWLSRYQLFLYRVGLNTHSMSATCPLCCTSFGPRLLYVSLVGWDGVLI
jgi:hypothetical protein